MATLSKAWSRKHIDTTQHLKHILVKLHLPHKARFYQSAATNKAEISTNIITDALLADFIASRLMVAHADSLLQYHEEAEPVQLHGHAPVGLALKEVGLALKEQSSPWESHTGCHHAAVQQK